MILLGAALVLALAFIILSRVLRPEPLTMSDRWKREEYWQHQAEHDATWDNYYRT